MSGVGAGWLIEALIASTLLMGVVLAVRKPAQRAFGPQLAYWLWALPALRMAMPPLPAAWREQATAPIAAATESVRVLIVPAIAADPVASPVPWAMLIAAAWLTGAGLFFAWHGAAHLRYVRRILAPPARSRRLDDGTTLVESDAAVGPVAFGVLRRFVAVPRDFSARFDADERRLALAHELGHHARGDLIANWIGLALLAVHWFNPLAWVAYRKFRADQEMANDARVLTALPPMERHAYACAILKAAHGRAVTAACHLHTIEDLKGRLKMLKANRKSRRVLLAGATGMAALTAAALGLTASGAAAEQIRTVAAVQVPALVAQVSPPAPPAPIMDSNGNYLTELSDRTTDQDGRRVRALRLVVRSRDGKTQIYRDAEAEAYLSAHPEMQPPAPPEPPVPGAAQEPPLLPVPPLPLRSGAVPPPPPLPPQVSVYTTDGDRTVVKTFRHAGRDGYAYGYGNAPEVVEGDCGDQANGQFTRNEKGRNGRARIVICKVQIERFAAEQVKSGRLQAQVGLAQALHGLEAGRAAIIGERNLSEEERQRALAGLDTAKAEIERQIRDARVD